MSDIHNHSMGWRFCYTCGQLGRNVAPGLDYQDKRKKEVAMETFTCAWCLEFGAGEAATQDTDGISKHKDPKTGEPVCQACVDAALEERQ